MEWKIELKKLYKLFTRKKFDSARSRLDCIKKYRAYILKFIINARKRRKDEISFEQTRH